MATTADGALRERVAAADEKSRGLRDARATKQAKSAESTAGLALYSLCIGGVAAIGGLAVAACIRPGSPLLVWFLATGVLTVAGALVAGPVLRAFDRQRAPRA